MDERFQKALNAFAALHRTNPAVVGILAAGSVVYGEPMANSDVDVYVVLRSGSTRTRGNVFISGVEIEYLINPVRQIRAYFKNEINNRSTAHMFANGIVVFSRGKQLEKLIAEARKIEQRPIPRLTHEERENYKYFIDDLHKDALDVYALGRSTEFNLVATQIIDRCLQAIARAHRVPSFKPKRALKELQPVDPVFAKYITAFYKSTELKAQLRALEAIIKHVEQLIGGRRPQTWKLTGPLKLQR